MTRTRSAATSKGRARVFGRSGDLRRDGLRLVQRPHHPLPLLGEARARAGHGLQPRDPHRRGAPVLQDARGGRRRCRGDHVRLRPARQRRPGRRRGELRLDRILEKLLEDAFAWILLSGMVAGVPGHGGATWAVLQYVRGLRRLGHDVVLVEPVKSSLRQVAPTSPRSWLSSSSAGARRSSSRRPEVDRASVSAHPGCGPGRRPRHQHQRHAPPSRPRRAGARPAVPRPRPCLQPALGRGRHRRRPRAAHTFRHGRARRGAPGSTLPSAGRSWLGTPQPVVLADWPVAGPAVWEGLTTVGNWRSYGSIERDGVRYGQGSSLIPPLLRASDAAAPSRLRRARHPS